jgi:hypothetical protein
MSIMLKGFKGDAFVVETYKDKNTGNWRKKCMCGSIVNFSNITEHTKTKKHIKYMEQLKTQKIPEQLPEIIPEIAKPSIPDVLPEPEPEIIPSIDDAPLTKAEIRKQYKKEYMREYMKKYHAKRYNEDEEYRKYRIEMTNKSSSVMRSNYVKAYQYIKENNILIF